MFMLWCWICHPYKQCSKHSSVMLIFLWWEVTWTTWSLSVLSRMRKLLGLFWNFSLLFKNRCILIPVDMWVYPEFQLLHKNQTFVRFFHLKMNGTWVIPNIHTIPLCWGRHYCSIAKVCLCAFSFLSSRLSVFSSAQICFIWTQNWLEWLIACSGPLNLASWDKSLTLQNLLSCQCSIYSFLLWFCLLLLFYLKSDRFQDKWSCIQCLWSEILYPEIPSFISTLWCLEHHQYHLRFFMLCQKPYHILLILFNMC